MEFLKINDTTFELNQRITDSDGNKATIRYIGPVAAAKNPSDIWLGDMN